MLISFYHISLCPRCARVRKHLKEFLGDSYAVLVVEKNILRRPNLVWSDGIRMVPAIKIAESQLTGITLSRESIRQFLESNGYRGTAK